MVEMRWFIRKPKSTRLPPIKVLQYRYATKRNSGDAEYLTWLEWSEWIDVPTVKEE